MQVTSWEGFSGVINPMILSPCPLSVSVEEIRLQDESGIYRVVYTARLEDAVYVLHAFQKKTQTTSKRDIELAAKRYNYLMTGKP